MTYKMYRVPDNNKPSYLDKNARYIAISINHGFNIHFYPVRNHPNSVEIRKILRREYNALKGVKP